MQPDDERALGVIGCEVSPCLDGKSEYLWWSLMNVGLLELTSWGCIFCNALHLIYFISHHKARIFSKGSFCLPREGAHIYTWCNFTYTVYSNLFYLKLWWHSKWFALRQNACWRIMLWTLNSSNISCCISITYTYMNIICVSVYINIVIRSMCSWVRKKQLRISTCSVHSSTLNPVRGLGGV